MKESLWGYYLVLLGITVSTVMIMVSNMTTTNQQNYYLLKEVTNAAMIDAIDYSYYRKYGEMKIIKEKFVENFLRRFSEGISKTNTYKVDFYSIYESPPSVSIRVSSKTGDYNISGDSMNLDVVNSIDAILEANNTIAYSKIYYSMPYAKCDKNKKADGFCQLISRVHLNEGVFDNIKKELKDKYKNIDKDKIRIMNVEYLAPMGAEDVSTYYDNYGLLYNRDHSRNDIPKSLIVSYDDLIASDIKNVKVTLKEEKNSNKYDYYLAYGLDFKCEGNKNFNYYRKKDITDSIVNDIMKGYDSVDKYYITSDSFNNKTDAEKSYYEKVPYWDNCLIGIKFKVNFYYDGELY